MKLKWLKKRFTFMIIPDADANRSVLRLRIHGMLLYLTASVLFVLVASSLTIYFVHWKTASIADSLKKQLSGQAQDFNHTVKEKDSKIAQLQNKVIQLSQQADEIKVKVTEMEKLDNEVRSLTGKDGASASSKSSDGNGTGGPFIAVDDHDIDTLADSTQANYKALGEKMNDLFGNLEETKKKVIETQHLLQITPTIWPVDSREITSPFGYRTDPITFQPTFHSGIDIRASIGDPVYVTADGVVVSTGYDSSHGNNIVVNHSNGIRTWYMHLNKILVSPDDQVTKGQKIGLAGTTGRSTGPHLHYEVKRNGVSIDPKPYLKASRKGD